MRGSTVWLGTAPILLASTSRVRRALIEAAGVPVEAEASGIDERAVEASLGPVPPSPDALARRLACDKAQAVASRHPGRLVVGADQVLDLDGTTWPKPSSPGDAGRQLERLSGRTHALHAAVCLMSPGGEPNVFADTARLTMRDLGPDAIAAYLSAAGEAVTRSAGGYEIEGLGIHLFSKIAGQHTTILGLPMLPLLAALRILGLLRL